MLLALRIRLDSWSPEHIQDAYIFQVLVSIAPIDLFEAVLCQLLVCIWSQAFSVY